MRKEKSRLIIAYSISAILLALYLYVLWLDVHPQVSKEYRLFYLENTSKIMSTKGSLAVKPGVNLYLNGKEDSDEVFTGIGQGWYWNYTGKGVENDGYCYTGEINNYLIFDFNESIKNGSDGAKLSLHITKSTIAAAEVSANGESLGMYDLKAGEETVIDIPSDIIAQGDVIVDLQLSNDDEIIAIDYLRVD